MSLPIHLALVPDGVDIDSDQLTTAAAALSKQVLRDFSPLWNVNATLDAFSRLEDVPSDYWKVRIVGDVEDAAGFHEDKDGQPFAMVEFDEFWTLTASHEVLEMLADPFGRRLRGADLLPQALELDLPPRRVRYLVEVCDPSEDVDFAYTINGILVSDFYTPNFFDPVTSAGTRYSFSGKITAPLQVLKNGYISWLDPVTDHWMQLRMFSDESSSKAPHVIDLSTDELFEKLRQSGNLRSAIDRVTKRPLAEKSITKAKRALVRQKEAICVQSQTALPRSSAAPVAGKKSGGPKRRPR
jgi:hypothetical protein